jgi:hypothetical protein
MDPILLSMQTAIDACRVSGVRYLNAIMWPAPRPTLGIYYSSNWVQVPNWPQPRPLLLIERDDSLPGRIEILRPGRPVGGTVWQFDLPDDHAAAVALVEELMSKAMPVLFRCLTLMGYNVGRITGGQTQVFSIISYSAAQHPRRTVHGHHVGCGIASSWGDKYELQFYYPNRQPYYCFFKREFHIPAPTTVQGGAVQVTDIVKEVLRLIAYLMPVTDDTDEEHPMPPGYIFPWTTLP